MIDYISRDEALNFDSSIESELDHILDVCKGMALYANHIKEIPTADVRENIYGAWVSPGHGDTPCVYICSACNSPQDRRTKFCPECGADMRRQDV